MAADEELDQEYRPPGYPPVMTSPNKENIPSPTLAPPPNPTPTIKQRLLTRILSKITEEEEFALRDSNSLSPPKNQLPRYNLQKGNFKKKDEKVN